MLIYFKKTALKKALTNAKKLLDKNETLVNISVFNNTLSITSANQHLIYHNNLEIQNDEMNQFIKFKLDSKILNDALLGKDRDIDLEITKEEVKSTELGNLVIPISDYEIPDKLFSDLSDLPYIELADSDNFYYMMEKLNTSFIESHHYYADFAKITDMNSTIFNPELFCVYRKKYNEDMNIDKTLGNNGLTLHKSAINIFVKNNNPKNTYQYLIIKNQNLFILRNQDEYHCFKFNTTLEFPDIVHFNPKKENMQFLLTNDIFNRIAKEAEKIKAEKIQLSFYGNSIDIVFDSKVETKFKIELEDQNIYMDDVCFNYKHLKTFLNDGEDTLIHYITFTNNFTSEGFAWITMDDKCSKFIPGIKTSNGFNIDDETAARFSRELDNLDAEIAILNRSAEAES